MEKYLPESVQLFRTHAVPLTPRVLAEVLSRTLAYPYRGLCKSQMMLVQERFVQMRAHPHVLLLLPMGAVRHKTQR
jgi:hypothetical protein